MFLINANPDIYFVISGELQQIVVLLLRVDDDEVGPRVLPALGPGRLPLHLVLVVIFPIAGPLVMFPALPTPWRGRQRSLTDKLGLAGRVGAELVSEVTRGQQASTPPGRVLGRVIVSPGGEVRVDWGAVQPPPPPLAGELQADPPVDREVRVVLSNPGADWPLLSAKDPPHFSPGADPLSLVLVVNNHQLRVKTPTG